MMEARGIEPRSELRSQTVSTCVARALSSPEAGTRTSNFRKSSLRSHAGLESNARRQPDFPIPTHRLRRAATWAGAKQSLRSQSQISVGNYWFSQLFNQGLRTWARNRIFTKPVEASRPLCYKLNLPANL